MGCNTGGGVGAAAPRRYCRSAGRDGHRQAIVKGSAGCAAAISTRATASNQGVGRAAVSLCAAASRWFFWQPGVFYNGGAAGAALVALLYGALAASLASLAAGWLAGGDAGAGGAARRGRVW